jgi:hypothetical protein
MPAKAPTKKELLAKIEFLQNSVQSLMEDKRQLIQKTKLLRRRIRLASVCLGVDAINVVDRDPSE